MIFELNLNNILGRTGGRDVVFTLLGRVLKEEAGGALAINRPDSTHPYIFAHLTVDQIFAVARADDEQAKADRPMTKAEATAAAAKVYWAIMAFNRMQTVQVAEPSSAPPSIAFEAPGTAPNSDPASTSQAAPADTGSGPAAAKPAMVTQTRGPGAEALRAIFRIWESQRGASADDPIHPDREGETSAQLFRGRLATMSSWAVLDSGVDKGHSHFSTFDNLTLPAPLTDKSQSFKAGLPWDHDAYGHGTHVAGIICGQAKDEPVPVAAIQAEASSGRSVVSSAECSRHSRNGAKGETANPAACSTTMVADRKPT